MQPRPKIRLDTVRNLQSMLEAMPEQLPQEVTKREAVRLLAPQIAALQARGHTLEHIARALAGNGLPISAVVLKNYLSGIQGKARRRKQRAPKQKMSGRPVEVSGSLARSASPEALAATRPPPRPRDRPEVSTPTSASRIAAPPVRSATAAPLPGPGGFIPRPDSEDL